MLNTKYIDKFDFTKIIIYEEIYSFVDYGLRFRKGSIYNARKWNNVHTNKSLCNCARYSQEYGNFLYDDGRHHYFCHGQIDN